MKKGIMGWRVGDFFGEFDINHGQCLYIESHAHKDKTPFG